MNETKIKDKGLQQDKFLKHDPNRTKRKVKALKIHFTHKHKQLMMMPKDQVELKLGPMHC